MPTGKIIERGTELGERYEYLGRRNSMRTADRTGLYHSISYIEPNRIPLTTEVEFKPYGREAGMFRAIVLSKKVRVPDSVINELASKLGLKAKGRGLFFNPHAEQPVEIAKSQNGVQIPRNADRHALEKVLLAAGFQQKGDAFHKGEIRIVLPHQLRQIGDRNIIRAVLTHYNPKLMKHIKF